MRHGKKVAKLGRTHSHRKAMMANMVTSLFQAEMIHTTDTRAKELRRTADHMITFAKRGDLNARRQVLRLIADKKVVAKLFDEIGPRYANRNGGYTRAIKTGPRRGDGAVMCMIELVDRPGGRSGRAKPASSEAAAEKPKKADKAEEAETAKA